MSKGQHAHLHHDTATATFVCHDPEGKICGYIARVLVADRAKPCFVPLDEHRKPLAAAQDTRERAFEWVVER
jgi:hypothetical protein